MMQVGFEKPSKENSDKDSKPTEEINVLMGVFFDGTGNNKINIDLAKSHTFVWLNARDRTSWSDSYMTDYSNVAQEYNAYKHTLDGSLVKDYHYVRRVYVTGIGTSNRVMHLETDGLSPDLVNKKAAFKKEYGENVTGSNCAFTSKYEGDKTIGNGFGAGSTGVVAKVKLGCENIYKDLGLVLDVASETKKVSTVNLSLDVYGFSRGAAAARCFVNCIEEKHGKVSDKAESLISYWFNKKGYGYSSEEKVTVKVNVRFLGLYDTVSSYGGWRSFGSFDNDVKELGLDFPSAKFPQLLRGVQFCAAEEYRANFSLSTVDSYKSKIKQFIFPGAHSDIGGGYKRKDTEDRTLGLDKMDWYERGLAYAKQYVFRKGKFKANDGFKSDDELEREGWFKKDEPQRTVYNTYSLIPLFLMLDETIKDGHDCIIDENALKDANVRLESEKSKLSEIHNRLKGVVGGGAPLYKLDGKNNNIGEVSDKVITPCFKNIEGDPDFDMIKAIRHDFIHLSSHSVIVHKPNANNIRKIING